MTNAAVEGRFYEVDLGAGVVASSEESLAELESRASPIIRKVLTTESLACLSIEERETLAAIVAAQFLRTTGFREQMSGIDEAIEAGLSQEGVDPTIVKLCAAGSELDTALYYRKLTSTEIKLSALEMLGSLIPKFTRVLSSKHWCLIKCAQSSLDISDHPVCLHNEVDMSPCGNLGLMVRGIEIYMPISPMHCLWMVCPETYSWVPEALMVEQKCVARLNCLQTKYSSRFLFAKSRNFFFAEQYLNEYPSARTPRRIEVV